MGEMSSSEKLKELSGMTDLIVQMTRDICTAKGLPESGLVSVMLYAFNDLFFEHIEKCVNEVGPDAALTFIGINMKAIQSIVQEVIKCQKEIEEFKEKKRT